MASGRVFRETERVRASKAKPSVTSKQLGREDGCLFDVLPPFLCWAEMMGEAAEFWFISARNGSEAHSRANKVKETESRLERQRATERRGKGRDARDGDVSQSVAPCMEEEAGGTGERKGVYT